MRRFYLLFFLVFVSLTSLAQTKPTVPETHFVSNGKYKLSYYAANIIKLTFIPDGYTRPENVSDAVILKPKVISSAAKVKVNGDIVSFNGKAILIKADTMSG